MLLFNKFSDLHSTPICISTAKLAGLREPPYLRLKNKYMSWLNKDYIGCIRSNKSERRHLSIIRYKVKITALLSGYGV